MTVILDRANGSPINWGRAVRFLKRWFPSPLALIANRRHPMNDTATAPSSHDANCDTINTLLLGELAAVETYDQAMEKLEDQHILADLERFREEHARAVRVLREQIVNHGGEPVECTGPWGAFAAVVAGTEHIGSPATALLALRQGEEHGINGCEDALGNEAVAFECKEAIRTELLPRLRGHVEELNRLMGGMS